MSCRGNTWEFLDFQGKATDLRSLDHTRIFHYLYTSIANSHKVNHNTFPSVIFKLKPHEFNATRIMIYGTFDRDYRHLCRAGIIASEASFLVHSMALNFAIYFRSTVIS